MILGPGGGPDLAPLPIPGGGGWVGLAINILGSLLGISFGGGAVSQLEQQITQLRDQATQALHAITGLAVDIARTLGALLTWLHDLWTGLMQSILNFLKLIRQALKWLVQTGIPALLKALRNLRKLLDDIYRRYIRPVLQYLQLIRRVLTILSLFHVRFAAKLDQWIASVEGRIIGPFLYVLRVLNGFGSWVNLIVTAGGIIQRPVFINTMYAYQRDWANLWWAGQSASMGAGVPPTPGAPAAPRPPQLIAADFKALATANAGPYADVGQRSMTTFNSVLAGGPAIPGAFNPTPVA